MVILALLGISEMSHDSDFKRMPFFGDLACVQYSIAPFPVPYGNDRYLMCELVKTGDNQYI